MINLANGNLLQSNAEALVNTVNCVGVMGKGIALQFKRAYPNNSREYEKACKNEQVKIGQMLVHSTGAVFPPRFIINFPTKKHWKEMSKLSYIEEGLVDLVRQIDNLGITSIAIPPLGCGNGGLRWSQVRPMIEDAFAALPSVRVELYEPAGAPLAEAMPNLTSKPRMTPVRAAYLRIFGAYLQLDFGLFINQLVTQKLSYFLQFRGEPLKLTFDKDRYGPYADTLRHVLSSLEGHYITGYGDGSDINSEIKLLPSAFEDADKELESESAQRIYEVIKFVDGFHSQYLLELLSTVHWVATHDPRAAESYSYVVSGVKSWSERKRELFKAADIKLAWEHLHEFGWLQKPKPPETKYGQQFDQINWNA